MRRVICSLILSLSFHWSFSISLAISYRTDAPQLFIFWIAAEHPFCLLWDPSLNSFDYRWFLSGQWEFNAKRIRIVFFFSECFLTIRYYAFAVLTDLLCNSKSIFLMAGNRLFGLFLGFIECFIPAFFNDDIIFFIPTFFPSIPKFPFFLGEWFNRFLNKWCNKFLSLKVLSWLCHISFWQCEGGYCWNYTIYFYLNCSLEVKW